ncbi:MAG: hypothetical protein K8T91_05800 [Planctomycetes bacterium]|nr:hypothetical protein [Planctomycetota bacterium]
MSAIEDGGNSGAITLEALIDGLRVARPPLNQKCTLAIRALGNRVIPWLTIVADDKGIGLGHRQRLLAIIDQIEEADDEISDGVAGLILDALLAALRVSDPELNHKATRAIICSVPDSVDLFSREALAHVKQTNYCLNLLRAAELTGQRPGVETFFDLWAFLQHKNPDIRNQVMRIFLSWSPHCGPPKEDQDDNCRPGWATATVVAKQ